MSRKLDLGVYNFEQMAQSGERLRGESRYVFAGKTV